AGFPRRSPPAAGGVLRGGLLDRFPFRARSGAATPRACATAILFLRRFGPVGLAPTGRPFPPRGWRRSGPRRSPVGRTGAATHVRGRPIPRGTPVARADTGRGRRSGSRTGGHRGRR